MGPLVIYTVRDLEDKLGGVTIRIRILSKGEPRTVKTRDGQEHTVVDAIAGDRTGSVRLSLWDERIKEVEEGDIVDVDNGYSTRFRGRVQLNVGKYGTLEKVEDPGFASVEELSKARRRYTRRGTGTSRRPHSHN